MCKGREVLTGFDLCRSGRDHLCVRKARIVRIPSFVLSGKRVFTNVTKLVGNTREGGAEGRRRDFRELDGNLGNGNVSGSASVKRYIGFKRTTPHAPWTPNWMQNAPAARPLKLVGRIQSGMNAAVNRDMSKIARSWTSTEMRLTANQQDEDAMEDEVSGQRGWRSVRDAYMMVRRRPMYCDTYPAMAPPLCDI